MIQNPFKFLESYDKSDKDRFFGRNKETAQLYNAVHASNLILLYGASGTGKTSLVNCGLANQFHDTDWLPIFIRRGNNVNQSMIRELSKFTETPLQADTSLRHAIRDLYQETYRPAYLIFDQFEELYIMGDKEEQDTFHKTISELLQASLQCKILIIIREEYIAYLSEFEKIVPPLFDNRLRIEKMNDRNLSKVIMGTCKYGNIKVHEPRKTVAMMLENLRSPREGIDLTNLQVYLDRLWRRDLDRRGVVSAERAPENFVVAFDPELVDMVIYRENTEDIYAGIEYLAGTAKLRKLRKFLMEDMKAKGIRFPDTVSLGVKPVSVEGTERLVRSAIQHAIDNNLPSVTLVHKGNIMKFTEGKFKEWGYDLAKKEFGAKDYEGGPWQIIEKDGHQVIVKDVIADAFLQQILTRPKEYSVIATLNLNGDYVSDALAATVGGIGIAPGANINYETGIALFEATHGTAPKYTGQDKVNPSSVILSGVMMLDYMGWGEAGDLIVKGIEGGIAKKRVTYDFERLMEGATKLKCSEFGSEIIANM